MASSGASSCGFWFILPVCRSVLTVGGWELENIPAKRLLGWPVLLVSSSRKEENGQADTSHAAWASSLSALLSVNIMTVQSS